MAEDESPDGQPADADVRKDPEPKVDPDPVVPKSEFEKVILQRQELKQKLREYEAKDAERDAKAKADKQAKLREAERFAELEQELRADLEAKDKIAADLQTQIDGVHKEYRKQAMLGALAEKTGQGRYVLAGLLANAEGEGLDVAPEQVSDKAVDTILRHFKKQAPELFKQESRGGSPGAPGLNLDTKPPEEQPFQDDRQKYFEMGRRHSPRRPFTTMPTPQK